MLQELENHPNLDANSDFWGRAEGRGEAGTVSPFLYFSTSEWEQFRADTPLTLTEDEVRRLRSLNDPVSLNEVQRIYLSMSRLLYSHVESAQKLFSPTPEILKYRQQQNSICHRHCRVGGGGKIDDGQNSQGTVGALAFQPQGRFGHHRWFPAFERRIKRRKD